MKHTKFVLVAAVIAAASFSIGRFLTPAKIETKTVERIVYHETSKKDTHIDVTERKKETTLPDGTKVIEIIREDKTRTVEDSSRGGSSDRSVHTKMENRPDWRVGAVYHPYLPRIQEEKYGLTIERRILSEVYLGVTASMDGTVGIVLSFGF